MKPYYDSQYRRERRECKTLVGKIVRLTRPLRTNGGDEYQVGELFRVDGTWRGRFHLKGVTPSGNIEIGESGHVDRYVRQASRGDFELCEAGPLARELREKQRLGYVVCMSFWLPQYRSRCLTQPARNLVHGAYEALTGMKLACNEYYFADAMSDAIECAEALGL